MEKLLFIESGYNTICSRNYTEIYATSVYKLKPHTTKNLMQSTTSDHNVTETAFDAAKCKLCVSCLLLHRRSPPLSLTHNLSVYTRSSAATQRYFDDAFLHHFVPRPSRRIPLVRTPRALFA